MARWLHTGWYQPIEPYEKLRIHLRPSGPLGREKPKRARNLGLRPFDFSIVFSIWQFVQQPVRIPAAGLQGPSCIACATLVADHPARS